MNDSKKVEYLMRLYGIRPVFAVFALIERNWSLLEASRDLLDKINGEEVFEGTATFDV